MEPITTKQRILNSPFTRILLGLLVCFIAFIIAQQLASKILDLTSLDKNYRNLIKGILSSAAVISAYIYFFKKYEKRDITEFSSKGIIKYTTVGILIGSILQCLTVLVIVLNGGFEIVAVNPLSNMIIPFTVAFSVAVFEEILIRVGPVLPDRGVLRRHGGDGDRCARHRNVFGPCRGLRQRDAVRDPERHAHRGSAHGTRHHDGPCRRAGRGGPAIRDRVAQPLVGDRVRPGDHALGRLPWQRSHGHRLRDRLRPQPADVRAAGEDRGPFAVPRLAQADLVRRPPDRASGGAAPCPLRGRSSPGPPGADHVVRGPGLTRNETDPERNGPGTKRTRTWFQHLRVLAHLPWLGPVG